MQKTKPDDLGYECRASLQVSHEKLSIDGVARCIDSSSCSNISNGVWLQSGGLYARHVVEDP